MTVLLRVGLACSVLLISLVGSFLLYRAVQPAPVSTAAAVVPHASSAISLPTPLPQAASRLRVAPLLAPPVAATSLPEATSSPVPPSATIEPSATTIPGPTAFPKLSVASFHAPDGGMRRNIEVAVNANGDALRHVVIAPGATFSFNGALGARPEALPWRMVGRSGSAWSPQGGVSWAVPTVGGWLVAMDVLTPTIVLEQATPVPEAPTEPPPLVISTEPPAPAEQPSAVSAPAEQPSAVPPDESPTAAPSAPTAVATPEISFPPVLGGGVCDLASRFVVTGRTLLPPKAFRFKPHPGGIAGLRKSDAVSIWATNSGRYDNDLLITNTTKRWLVYEVYLDADLVTVVAWLQDGP